MMVVVAKKKVNVHNSNYWTDLSNQKELIDNGVVETIKQVYFYEYCFCIQWIFKYDVQWTNLISAIFCNCFYFNL